MIDLLLKLGFHTVPASFYGEIANWLAWYQGEVSDFHSYAQFNGRRRIQRKRASLGMAKRVCEDWANLLLNERVDISTPNAAHTKRLWDILTNNNFRMRANQLVELAFALGTGAFVEYKDGFDVKLDYVRADMVFPLGWDQAGVYECAFASEKMVDGKRAVYLQIHQKEGGRYVVKNALFDYGTHAQVPLPKGVEATFYTGSEKPLFQLISPNLVNSVDLGCPMGMSVYAGALDVLKGIDLVYDSYQNEYRLGKKRIVVPVGMAQLLGGEGMVPVFDDNDTEFYAIAGGDAITDLREINMEIRSAQHKEGLMQNLRLLADKCGLGADRFSYERSGVKTATEVISEKSDLYQNLKKHELVLKKALLDLSRAVLFLDGVDQADIRVDFDDSIITDTQTAFSQNVKLLELGVMRPDEFRQWWFHESPAQAKRALSLDESLSAGPDVKLTP